MSHGGRREGSGRKPAPDPALLDSRQALGPVSSADRQCYAVIISGLNRPAKLVADKDGPADSYELQKWRELSEAQDLRLRLDTRKYLYDKRDGKAIQPVDVDANLDSNVTIYLGPLTPKEFRGRPAIDVK